MRPACPHRCHDGGVDGLHVTGRVQQHATLRLRGGDVAKTLPHAGVECRVQPLVSVGITAAR